MKEIGKDLALFEFLKKDYTILDSQILGLNIHVKDFSLIIEVEFQIMRHLGGGRLKIIFSNIKQYNFYDSDPGNRYVENFKLLYNDNLFYISVDPDEENMSIMLETDNYFILCGNIEGYRY